MTTSPKPAKGTAASNNKTATTKKAPAKEAPAPKAKSLSAAGPKGSSSLAPAPSFHAEDTNGYHQCRICLMTLPVNSFPTISGPELRSTRCRKCRDNVSPTVQAKRAAAQAIEEAEALLKTTAAAQAKKPRKQQ
ncbi:MAG: hypothetical protein HY828_17640 [Actinobacteria bacterium]|nr:hypothetical protein [Actinomycetota bacterium]